MRILLIGGGGREHALARKLIADDPQLDLHMAPGNPGMAELGTCHGIGAGDVEALVALALTLRPDLVLIGPEDPLTRGLADQLKNQNIAVFGPDTYGAQLEASKGFAKEVMNAANVPTGKCEIYGDANQARAALPNWPQKVVIKADGLAAGKGVVVCENHVQALAAIEELSVLGQPYLIEEYLEGPELSFFALVNGDTVVPLTTAQDHKRVGEGDTGPNTGGMGAYSPGLMPLGASEQSLSDLYVAPIAREMTKRGNPFCGVLFVGLMLTDAGPKVLEYNVRFGDPECQVLMARLQSPLLPVLFDVLASKSPAISWSSDHAMTVVLAAQGYPASTVKGDEIEILSPPKGPSHLIHAGTKRDEDRLLTNGGRVMNCVGLGKDLQSAKESAYALIEQVSWRGMFYRRDIGWRAL